ncbi:MAG: hydroxylamine oxidoreductase, partial [Magnetococcales bacterium]|nr:hydroxylamine oxidoreductase [Magnetococcales bacterium]
MWITRALLVMLLGWMAPAWCGLPEPATGTGEHADGWRPDRMHEFWDPANHHRPERQPIEGIFAGEACLACHAVVTPGIVRDWRASGHARSPQPVLCPACHGDDHQKLALPTPLTCGTCHPQRLAEVEEEKRYGFPSHALAMERAVDAKHFADKPKAEVTPCLQCHSVATKCDSCHTRHRFDPAEARRPEACITCHAGPPHPDDASYFASPHGQAYLRDGKNWPWEAKLAEKKLPTPTCASCHMT